MDEASRAAVITALKSTACPSSACSLFPRKRAFIGAAADQKRAIQPNALPDHRPTKYAFL